jgi:hypothetical protein
VPKLGSTANTPDQEILRPRTRLQDGIRKKKYTDRMVRYGCLAISEEPSDVSVTLKDKHWKATMDDIGQK